MKSSSTFTWRLPYVYMNFHFYRAWHRDTAHISARQVPPGRVTDESIEIVQYLPVSGCLFSRSPLWPPIRAWRSLRSCDLGRNENRHRVPFQGYLATRLPPPWSAMSGAGCCETSALIALQYPPNRWWWWALYGTDGCEYAWRLVPTLFLLPNPSDHNASVFFSCDFSNP